MLLTARRPSRRSAFHIHLATSALVAGGVGALMFGLWYPGPFRYLAGGVTLFLLIAAVDVVLGPLLTLLVFDERKSRRELSLDLGVIVLLQAAALAYGAWTMAAARPVWLAFEVDLFRVVTAADVEPARLPEAPPELRTLSWRGPGVIGTDRPQRAQEQFEAIMLGASGIHLAMQPRYWLPYEPQRAAVLARARPLAELAPALRQRLPAELMPWPSSRRPALDQLRWLPVVSAHRSWTLLVDDTGAPVAFAPFEPQ